MPPTMPGRGEGGSGLERELDVYKRHQMVLALEHEGKFVLVHASGAVSVHESYAAATEAGYEHYGLDPFLVKRIARDEPVHFFSRSLPL